MPPILKRLRLKFMGMTTGIVAVLVAVIAGAFCVSAYTSVTTEIDFTLNHAIDSSMRVGTVSILFDEHGFPLGFSSISPENEGFAGIDNESADPSSEEQRLDLFRGKTALAYTALLDTDGTVLRNTSPAIEIDSKVLNNSISTIMTTATLPSEEGESISGRIEGENLMYLVKMQNGLINLSLTDATSFDQQLRDTFFGAVLLSLVALFLTVVVSFFLARLFMRPVEEAWNKQRRFIADASHELKTPLTVIMANAEIVRSEPEASSESQRKWIDGIVSESERMNTLIADLLALARLEDESAPDATPTASEIVDFSEAVDNTVVSFEAIAFERDVAFETAIEPGITIKGSPGGLDRLPDILVDNACKYTNSAGRIQIELTSTTDKAILQVRNTGPTISAEDREHLFDRFYRVDTSRSSDVPGHGLGLSIAQGIVEENKGTIDVSNWEEGGVVFTVTLPRKS